MPPEREGSKTYASFAAHCKTTKQKMIQKRTELGSQGEQSTRYTLFRDKDANRAGCELIRQCKQKREDPCGAQQW